MNHRHRGIVGVAVAIGGLLNLWAVEVQAGVLPPNPDNAALLYYQAFLLRSEPTGDTVKEYDEFVDGGELTESVRRCLRRIQDTITLADDAVRLPKCDWGIQYSRGFRHHMPQLHGVRLLARDLSAHAQMLAADGDGRAALNRCLMMRQVASQIGDDTPLLLAGGSRYMGRMALVSIQRVLGRVSPDADTLRWLERQLETVKGASPSPAHALRMDFELAIVSLRNRPDILKVIRNQLADRGGDPITRQAAANLTAEELIERARRPYASFLDSAIEIIDGNMPYAAAYARLQRLTENLKANYSNDPAANQIITACADSVCNNLWARDRAAQALLDTAIEVYLVAAETGRLPEQLADDWPRDFLTGESFDYEITKEGFILRSRDVDIPGGGNPPFEFKVRDPGLLRRSGP